MHKKAEEVAVGPTGPVRGAFEAVVLAAMGLAHPEPLADAAHRLRPHGGRVVGHGSADAA
jgi:hypothetical protein